MRIIFMGTPEFGVPTFNRLLELGHEIVACYSQPPRPAGRGQREKKSPVQVAAEAAKVPVFTPQSLRNEDAQKQFLTHGADLAIVVAYGLILPKAILDAPKYGCLNLHGSALPRWRGAAPIQRAIMAGDKSTAIQVMAMEEGLDTGAICASAPIEISADMNAGQLHDEMMRLGANLMGQTLVDLEQGNLRFTRQSDEGVTYAKKIEKSELQINWDKSAQDLHNLIRGLSPFPGMWSEFSIKGKSVRVKILEAEIVKDDASGFQNTTGKPGEILNQDLTISCAEGALRVKKVQKAGKGPMDTALFLRGAGDLAGQILTDK